MKWSNVRNAPRNGRLMGYQDNRNPRKNNSKVKPRSSKKVPNRKEKIERDRGKGGKKRRVQYLRWQHPRKCILRVRELNPPKPARVYLPNDILVPIAIAPRVAPPIQVRPARVHRFNSRCCACQLEDLHSLGVHETRAINARNPLGQ